MEPIEYLRIIRRRWRVVAACLVVAVVATWGSTPAQPVRRVSTSYRAEHTLLEAPEAMARVSLPRTALFIRRGEVPKRVAKKIGYPHDPAVLANRVQTRHDSEVGTLTITVSGSDGIEAARIANAFAEEILVYILEAAQRDQQAATEKAIARLDEVTAKITNLNQQINQDNPQPLLVAQRDAQINQYRLAYERIQLLASMDAPKPSMTTLQAATPIPVSQGGGFAAPDTRRGRVASAALLALALGCGLALVLERIDTKLRTKKSTELAFGLPVVGEIPSLKRRIRRDRVVMAVRHPASSVAEAYRSLRSSILLGPRLPALQWLSPQSDAPGERALQIGNVAPGVVLVTSPGSREGKTSTVVNLAACIAETGKSVLVLSCDFRRPDLHEYLGVPNGRGLSDLLAEELSGQVGRLAQTTVIPGVRVLVSGTSSDHPAALLARVGGIIEEARGLADVVLLDSAPLLAANDATDLISHADAVLLVCRIGRTSIDSAQRAQQLLARLGTPVIGVATVGNKAPMRSAYYYSGRREWPYVGSIRGGQRWTPAQLDLPVLDAAEDPADEPIRVAPAAPAVSAAPAPPARPVGPAANVVCWPSGDTDWLSANFGGPGPWVDRSTTDSNGSRADGAAPEDGYR